MEKPPRITLDPHIHGHRPSVCGLRIRVTDTPEMLATGATQREILEDPPYQDAAAIAATLACAARQIRRPIPQVA